MVTLKFIQVNEYLDNSCDYFKIYTSRWIKDDMAISSSFFNLELEISSIKWDSFFDLEPPFDPFMLSFSYFEIYPSEWIFR